MKKSKKFVAVSVKKTRKSKLQSKRYSQTWGYKPSGHRKSTPRKGTPRLTKPASGDNIGVNLRSKGTGNSQLGKLTYNKDGTWTSSGGLVYGPDKKFGNRVNHILAHTKPNPNKANHTVFNVDKTKVLGVVDEAWARKGQPSNSARHCSPSMFE